MALGDPYVTNQELKDYLTIPDAVDDLELTRVAAAVSETFIRYCNRDFNDAGAASARSYHPASASLVEVGDFHTTTGLVVKTDSGEDGTYETTLSASDYVLYPLDGVVDGQTGHPYRHIKLRRSATFPTGKVGPSVQVTARWGWAAVPDAVKQAALIQCGRVFGRRYAQHGLIGEGDFVFRVSTIAIDPDVSSLLAPYRLKPALVA